MSTILSILAEIVQPLPFVSPKLAQFLAFGNGSLAVAKLTRDVYRILCRFWPPQMQLRRVHHTALKNDLSSVSDELHQRSQWCHDVPEACVMFLSTLIYFYIAYLFV